jgi:REP-associated tyrosine transposase
MSEPSEIYYVVLRGAGRQPLFHTNEDRDHFTTVVAEAAAECGVTVYGYCWLLAEARLAVEISDISISRFSQRVAKQHAKRLERDVALTGSHFEQKCRGVKVDGQTALADLVRHVHLAPLKAGLTTDPAKYRWSSHQVYLGLAEAPWVTTEPLLKYFEQTDGEALRGYTRFMGLGMGMGAESIEVAATQLDPAAPIGTPRASAQPDKK